MNSRLNIEIKTAANPICFELLPFLTSFSVGGEQADICLPVCQENEKLLITFSDDLLSVSLENAIFYQKDTLSFCCNATQNTSLIVCNKTSGEYLFELTVSHGEKKASQFDWCINASDKDQLIFGASKNADIQLKHPLITGDVLILERTDHCWVAKPKGNIPFGIYKNGIITEQSFEAGNGDFIHFLGVELYLDNNLLYLAPSENINVQNLRFQNLKETPGKGRYPQLARTARIMPEIKTNDIEIKDPSAVPEENKNNLLISLLPALAMIVLTIFMRGSYSSNVQMVLFSALTLSIGAVSSVFTFLQTKKEREKKVEKRTEIYHAYIQEQETLICKARDEERYAFKSLYCDSKTQIQNVEEFSSTLFDRRPGDIDFLDIRFGYGKLRSQQKIICKKHEILDVTDELFELPSALQKKYEFNNGLPAYVQGKKANAIGVVGESLKLREMLYIMTLDLATRQYYEDVHLHYLLSDEYKNELHTIRLLPHLTNPLSNRRNIAFDTESRNFLLEYLFKVVSERAENLSPTSYPWEVIFVDTNNSSLMQHPLMKFVEEAAKFHVLFVFLGIHKQAMPQCCSFIVRLMSNVNKGLITSVAEVKPDLLFEYEKIEHYIMERTANLLAPVYSSQPSLSSYLTGKESLFDMLQITDVNNINIQDNWKNANAIKSLSAPLGIKDNGEILYLDLHEKGQGPHGLMAGMTGSGKSQVLISYILSLATHYSPDDVAFAVIDFKGGDIVKQLHGLPHIVGSITNIEKNEIARSLQSINAEKNKRMVLFDQNHTNVSNIYEYMRAYKNGKTTIPLPHLVIIVDEFAELKSQYPDFMAELISIARVGRSLGIHLILCTQKPAGIVDDQIWSNSNFHLCLRVQNQSDSNDVLHSPLAAEIKEPGRGYLQVENQLLELFQSGYSGTDENNTESLNKTVQVLEMDLAGRTHICFSQGKQTAETSKTQREALLERINAAFANSGKAMPSPLCMPPLPEEVPFKCEKTDDKFALPVGVQDDPDQQKIYPLCLNVVGMNTLIVGAGQMGKTNLLQTIIRSAAERMTTEDINIYALDFNAKAVKNMEALSIIGGVVTEEEEENMKSLLRLLKQEIGNRKAVFANQKVTNFASYKEKNTDCPAILVLIDNYAVFNELYEETYGQELTTLMREGPAYGISFIATVQHMAALNYRKHSMFTQRIAFTLNEQSEYAAVFDGCRKSLRSIPGRVLLCENKKFYEGQIYEVFSGKDETAKNTALQQFIEAHSASPKARPIPVVPALLTLEHIRQNYPQVFRKGVVPFAMEYSTVSPVVLDMNKMFSFSLIAGSEEQKLHLIKQMINHMLSDFRTSKVRLYIFDSYYKPLKEYRGHPAVAKYSCTPEEVDLLFFTLSKEMEREKEHWASQEDDDDTIPNCKVFVINSFEMIKHISENDLLMDQFRAFSQQSRRFNTFFLFCDVPNKTTKYSSPEILHYIVEDKQALLLSNLSSIKTMDIDYTIKKEHQRPLSSSEAFLMNGDSVVRIKMFDA